ncbi:TlpA family protein disulfide reductase [Hanstruepera flava]|uniref:TlpA family protein disulfide reductase n=1 Tax=Hanstruepera flava TaxID=2930218 RepID=UPI002028004B|nr:TlpA disulfide reductase family protein [Hanstruepera flava]
MKNYLCLLILVVIGITSCKEKSNENLDSKEKFEPIVNVNDLTSDHNKWYTYYYYDITLSADFKPLNEQSEVITKDEFFNELITGKYIPVEIKSDSLKIYKLYTIPPTANTSISNVVKSTAASAYSLYKMEGMKFPDFEFSDLNGKHYNNDSLIGKKTIIKTWFIACKPCVAEIPELNELVENYSDKKNIQFISLALDKNEPLIKFLNKTEFKYEVVAEQKNLIQNKLNLRAYPTHLIVDKNGHIEKVLSTASELITYLEDKQPVRQKELNVPPPPPPPVEKSDKNNA